jgi:PAS domain S-box-containing protein
LVQEIETGRTPQDYGLTLSIEPSGRIISFNKAAEVATGYTLEEIRGRVFWDVFLDEVDRDSVKAFFKNMQPEMFPNTSSYAWRVKSGKQRVISVRSMAVLDARGEIESVVCSGIDVTRLDRADEVFRIILETTMDGFCINDIDGKLLDINDAYCKMLGYTRDEILGADITDVDMTESTEEIADRIQRIMRDGRHRFETRHRRKDGAPIDIEASVSFAAVEGGRLYSFIHDITERKRTDAELQRHREELELLVRERTTELEGLNYQLRQEIADREQAERELLRMNKELEGYAQTVSHELRTPLSGILLALEYLQRIADKLSSVDERDEIDSIVLKAKSAVRKAESKVVCLLDLAKAGQVPAEVEDIDVTEVVTSILQEVGEDMRAAGVKVDPGGDLGHVVADGSHIHQVFANLISNAVAYCDSPDPRISISIVDGRPDGGKCWVVRDNGSGIPVELLDDLFMPFVRGDEGGSGIGLAIVDKIVKVYGGSIAVRNDPGACFELTLRDYTYDVPSEL